MKWSLSVTCKQKSVNTNLVITFLEPRVDIFFKPFEKTCSRLNYKVVLCLSDVNENI